MGTGAAAMEPTDMFRSLSVYEDRRIVTLRGVGILSGERPDKDTNEESMQSCGESRFARLD
jgi:hypothetical protein